MATVW